MYTSFKGMFLDKLIKHSETIPCLSNRQLINSPTSSDEVVFYAIITY